MQRPVPLGEREIQLRGKSYRTEQGNLFAPGPQRKLNGEDLEQQHNGKKIRVPIQREQDGACSKEGRCRSVDLRYLAQKEIIRRVFFLETRRGGKNTNGTVQSSGGSFS